MKNLDLLKVNFILWFHGVLICVIKASPILALIKPLWKDDETYHFFQRSCLHCDTYSTLQIDYNDVIVWCFFLEEITLVVFRKNILREYFQYIWLFLWLCFPLIFQSKSWENWKNSKGNCVIFVFIYKASVGQTHSLLVHIALNNHV